MTRKLSLACSSLLLLASLTRGEEEAPAAPSLDEKTFKEQVGESPHFVMFYAPWCGHCKRLAPIWEELATAKHQEGEVTVAKVDCTVATALCSAQDVTGYPTLKFFKNGFEKDDGVKYRGNRDLAALEKFIAEKLGNEIPEEAVAKATESAEPVVEGGLYILGEASFAPTVATADTFVKFYAPWCGHCQKLAPAWEELAKAFEKDEQVKIAKVDCTQHQAVCQEHEIKGYPTLAYFRAGSKMETYKGARTLSELKEFVAKKGKQVKEVKEVKEIKEEAIKQGAEDGKVPEVKVAGKVARLDNDNFAEITKTGVAFVKFFAPWCGHCKSLVPTWEQMAAKFKDNALVTIGHVDCTVDRPLCSQHEIKGYPTLVIFKDGQKVLEFKGRRSLEELAAFVQQHLAGLKAAKVEL